MNFQLDDNIIERIFREHLSAVTGQVMALTPVDPRYVFHTVAEVAARLKCKPDTVRGYINNGKKTFTGRVVKLKTIDLVASEYRITEADLRAFVDTLNADTSGIGIKFQ